MARERRADNGEIRASSHRLPRSARRDDDLHQAFPGPEPARRTAAVGSPGQGSKRRQAIGAPGDDRRADDHPRRAGRAARRKFLFENYLVTPAISDTIPLDEFVQRRLPGWPEPEHSTIRRKLARAVAVMTAQLHDAGLLHHDFHPGNILVRLERADQLELFMIDLDAMRKCRRVTWKLARQNLALLDHYFWLRSSRTDRFRFLKAYLGAQNEASPPVGRFAKEIEDTTRLWAEPVAAVGPAVPIIEQVFRGLSGTADPLCGVARSGRVGNRSLAREP